MGSGSNNFKTKTLYAAGTASVTTITCTKLLSAIPLNTNSYISSEVFVTFYKSGGTYYIYPRYVSTNSSITAGAMEIDVLYIE